MKNLKPTRLVLLNGFLYCTYIGNDDFAEEKLAMMLSKGSPYLNRINKELSKFDINNIMQWFSTFFGS